MLALGVVLLITTSLIVPGSALAGPPRQTLAWTQHVGSGPPARNAAMMVYDAALGEDVLFGGVLTDPGEHEIYNDTWTYNGTTWTQQNPATSPPAAYFSSMAYDAALGVVVLYINDNSQTWTYNGTTWTQQFPADNPGDVNGPSMDYDAALGEIVLITQPADSTPTATDQTWTYNGSNWVQQDPSVSPPYSADFELSYDPGIGQMVLFGGYGNMNGNALKTTWTYNGVTWAQPAPATSPPAAEQAPMSYDAALNEMILLTESGSGSPTSAMESWAYDGTNWTLLDTLSGPSRRILTVMADDPASNQLVLFGGLNNTTSFTAGDTWTANATSALPHGYWLVGSDGGVFTFGQAQFHGSTGSMVLQRPVVGITPTADNNGYWLVATDGGVFAYGDAGFYGSIPGIPLNPARSGLSHSLNAPIVAMVPTYDDGGYFMVASDGGVFSFGDAKFEGSCPGIGGCEGAAVAVMPDASGNGYWVVTSSGHVYTFGDAQYFGAPGRQSVPVTSAVRTPDGSGYWILFGNGAVAAYGDAVNSGGPVNDTNGLDPATAIFAAYGGGYWITTAEGAVFSYGGAQFSGSMGGTKLNAPIIAATGF
jgi:hypothetical protein